MIDFTQEERKVVLFLAGVALAGALLCACIKVFPWANKAVKIEKSVYGININQASFEEILRSRSVPVKLAKKIVEYRQVYGQFKEIEELKQVKGVGKYRYEKLKDVFYVE